MTIFTIGHSTRPFDAFVALLQHHGVAAVADVRAIPQSRRHPQFSREALERDLPLHGIGYRHYPALGGLRRPRPDSINTAWRHPSFRAYADHMASPAFRAALDALVAAAETTSTAIMCAEAKWWQCHRQLIADALLARGITVRHILSTAEAPEHRLTSFAHVDHGEVTYPGLV